MLQEKVRARNRPASATRVRPGLGSRIHRQEILQVLERAAEDNGFIAELTDGGEGALEGYNLTVQERAALLSGDIRWLEARLGKLDARQRTWLNCRLQQERW
jgi:hypothetical protein